VPARRLNPFEAEFEHQFGFHCPQVLAGKRVSEGRLSANDDHFTAGGVAHTLRGKDEMLEGPAAAIKLLTDSLRTSGQEYVCSAISFKVKPRD